MKKVLILIGSLNIGGAEKIAFEIGNRLDNKQYQFDYIVYGDTIGDYEKTLITKGCHVFHMEAPSNGYWKYYRNLVNLFQAQHYDIVHAHTMFNSAPIIMIGALFRVPIRITHSHSIKGFQRRSIIRNIYEVSQRFLLRIFSTQCIACGEKAGEWLFGSRFFRKKGRVIINGIDVGKYRYCSNKRDEIRKKYGFSDKYIIGHVGHLLDVKNQEFLIRLMPSILEKKENAVLLLLGEGNKREYYHKIITELKLENEVLMLGNVKNVDYYLSAMDVFCFPSRYEGTPLTLLEAQANGIQCIISDQIPKDAIITDYVKVFPLSQPENWIQSICSTERPLISAQDEKQMMRMDISEMVKAISVIYEG